MLNTGRKESRRAVCPLGKCSTHLAPTELLTHIINDHLFESPGQPSCGLRMRKVATGQPTLLLLAYKQLVAGEDHCLGVLNWLPNGNRQLAPPQCYLPLCHTMLHNHLPILVMVCKTTWSSLVSNAPQRSNDDADGSNRGYMYIFWLTGPITRRPVNVNLRFLNQELCCGLRVVRHLRDFASRMHINRFLLGADRIYLTLNERQMNQMCLPNESACFLEVVILGEDR